MSPTYFSCLPCVVCQVVVKTKADYDAESKKGKLRSPKIAEFSISIIEGVSERLKVRIMTSSACFWSPSHTPDTAHMRTKPERETERTPVPRQLGTFITATAACLPSPPPPPQPLQNPHPRCSSDHLPPTERPVPASSPRATQGGIKLR